MVYRTIRNLTVAGLSTTFFLGMAAAQTPPPGTSAEDAAKAAEVCTSTHTGGQLAAVLCEPGLDQAIWAAAGHAACTGHALCAAWIYDEASKMPDPMPDRFEGLSQENVTSAVAVWAEEDHLLVTIARAE